MQCVITLISMQKQPSCKKSAVPKSQSKKIMKCKVAAEKWFECMGKISINNNSGKFCVLLQVFAELLLLEILPLTYHASKPILTDFKSLLTWHGLHTAWLFLHIGNNSIQYINWTID